MNTVREVFSNEWADGCGDVPPELLELEGAAVEAYKRFYGWVIEEAEEREFIDPATYPGGPEQKREDEQAIEDYENAYRDEGEPDRYLGRLKSEPGVSILDKMSLRIHTKVQRDEIRGAVFPDVDINRTDEEQRYYEMFSEGEGE